MQISFLNLTYRIELKPRIPLFLSNLRRGADKSLAFPICSATKRIFLGWVKEVKES
jgi:hypothetical protein